MNAALASWRYGSPSGRCSCGKAAAHLALPLDSPDWPCRARRLFGRFAR